MKPMNKTVTVGIPTYNTPIQYFRTLLDAVLGQTYKELDILIVDDASEKTFVDLLQDYQKKTKEYA